MVIKTGLDLHNALNKMNTNWFFVENGCWYGKRITRPSSGPKVIVIEAYKGLNSVNTLVLNENSIVDWDIDFNCDNCSMKAREERPIELLEKALELLKKDKGE